MFRRTATLLSILFLGSSCSVETGLPFLEPKPGLLTGASGPSAVALRLPPIGELVELEVAVDGAPSLGLADFTVEDGVARGELAGLGEGRFALSARAVFDMAGMLVTLESENWFERRGLDRPDDCELLNGADCLLPFPSSRYLTPAATPTGFEVAYPEGVLPILSGASLQSAPFGGQDGFSPAAQVLMHFPGGVDPVLSGASHLRADTRTFDDTSVQPDSPTLLIDVDSGMVPVPHFIEMDGRALAAGQPDRAVLFLRPAEGLRPGHRYLVAMRGLKNLAGEDIAAEPVFAALRDGRPSDIAGVEARREHTDWVLRKLEKIGVVRSELVLAFDFVVQSDEGLTREMLAMRDHAYAWLAAETDPTFSVHPFAGPGDDPAGDFSIQNDCSVPGTRHWRQLRGQFASPLFLDSDPLLDPVTGGRLVDADGDGLPEAQGLMNANFSINLPCEVLTAGEEKIAPIQHGPGLFGNARQAVGLAGALGNVQNDYGLPDFIRIAGATDWLGLSSFDLDFSNLFQPSFILQGVLFDANNFGALPDRLRQGMTNALVLGRMMKEGRFNAHPAFQTPDGEGVFPTGTKSVDYFGVSLGGVMGTQLAALSPDLGRVGADVPGSNFSIMIQRSAAIGLISIALGLLNPDPMAQALFFGLAEELWDSGEPAGYLRHVTEDPLPGSGKAKDMLMTVARFDGIVPNVATDIMARTLGLPNLHDAAEPSGSAISGRLGIPDVPGPLSADAGKFKGAAVWHDLGMYDLENPDDLPFVPPLSNQDATSGCDPHGRSFRTGAAASQITTWFETGEIVDTCDGLCDGNATAGGFAPFELFEGTEPCDPLIGGTPLRP